MGILFGIDDIYIFFFVNYITTYLIESLERNFTSLSRKTAHFRNNETCIRTLTRNSTVMTKIVETLNRLLNIWNAFAAPSLHKKKTVAGSLSR